MYHRTRKVFSSRDGQQLLTISSTTNEHTINRAQSIWSTFWVPQQ